MKKSLYTLFIILASLIAVYSCEKDPSPSGYLPPEGSLDSGTPTSELVSVTIPSTSIYNCNTGVYFGKKSDLSDKVKYDDFGYGYVTITDLIPGTVYYYRNYANLYGEYEITSELKSVSTESTWVNTLANIDVGSSFAEIDILLDDYTIVKQCGLYYSESSTLANKNTLILSSNPTKNNYTGNIEGLENDKTYYYCAYIRGNGFEITSEIKSFKTSPKIYTGDLFIYTQYSLNLYFNQYRYEIVNGNLIIGTYSTSEPSDWKVSWTIDGIKYYFSNNTNITDFSPLSSLQNVTGTFGMVSLQNMRNLYFLNSYSGNKLYLFDSDNLTNLSGIGYAKNLESLTVNYCATLTDISAVSSLSNLRYLYVKQNKVQSISAISSMVHLYNVDLCSNAITTIPSLTNLVNLTWLNLEDNVITDVSPLKNNSVLIGLYLHYNNISDIASLSNLPSLRYLSISHNNISSVESIKNLNLSSLYLGYASNETNTINDISPLSGMSTLSSLYLNYLPITSAQVDALQLLLPNCTIYSTGITGTSNAASSKEAEIYKRHIIHKESDNENNNESFCRE